MFNVSVDLTAVYVLLSLNILFIGALITVLVLRKSSSGATINFYSEETSVFMSKDDDIEIFSEGPIQEDQSLEDTEEELSDPDDWWKKGKPRDEEY